MTTEPPTPTQFQALKSVGYFRPIDWWILTILGGYWLTVFFWFIFSHPPILNLAIASIVPLGIAQLWIILLVYRSMLFTIQIRADINLIPADAAKLAIAFQRGQ